MRAIGLTEFGAADVLHELDVPAERLGPADVRIRVAYATVNPADVSLRRGDLEGPDGGTFVPGLEIAGTVTEVGEAVSTGVDRGDDVFGMVLRTGVHGGYRDELVLPALSVARVPSGTELADAATIPMNGLTAMQALDAVGLSGTQVLAVTGGAGAVGGYAIQLAKSRGLTVIADASPDDASIVRGLGADIVIPRGPSFAEQIRERFPAGVDGLIDAALLDAAALGAVRDGGRVATLRGFRGDGARGVETIAVGVRNDYRAWDRLERLRTAVERGALTTRVLQVVPAAEAADAHRRLEAGGLRGRLVLGLGG